MESIPGGSEAVAGPWSRTKRQDSPASAGQVDISAAADLATASDDAVAERARKALWRLLPHSALVIVTPGSDIYPVQIAAAQVARERLAVVDWMGLIEDQLPTDSRVSRLALPSVLVGLHLAGWVARAGGFTVVVIVGESGRLNVSDDQDQAGMLVAMLAAIRLRVVENAPPPGTLAFSRAMSQERERIRLELGSRHAATLSSLLHILRSSAASSGGAGESRAISKAIDTASRALLDLETERDTNGPSGCAQLAVAFEELAEELRGTLRSAQVELVADLDADDTSRIPSTVAHAARLISRDATLSAIDRPGIEKLRLRWRLTDDALVVSVADNGVGFDDRKLVHIRRLAAELRGRIDLDSNPNWGSSLTCWLPLHDVAQAPETPAVRRLAELRDREREVLELMISGLRNRDIAARLFISERTVKFHVSNILAKLQVGSRTEAIALAHGAGVSVLPNRED